MPAPRTCIALRHVAFEDLGSFAAVIESRGYAASYRDVVADDLAAADIAAADLVVILGGPIGVYERAEYPFLAGEIALAERRLRAGKPLLGICLGSQIMAAALGARVYGGTAGKEIGWAPLDFTAAGAASPLGHLGDTPVLHWHGDTFDLPAGSALLASTPRYAHQAFSFGPAALALQFHPEVTARGMEYWFVGHCCEIGATRGVDVRGLRAETARHAPALPGAGAAFLGAWLDGVAPAAP